MALYKTGNPVPSSAMPDVWDNNRVQDVILNSEDLEVENRTGNMIPTWNGLLKLNADAIDELMKSGGVAVYSSESVLRAATPADQHNLAVDSSTGNYYFLDTTVIALQPETTALLARMTMQPTEIQKAALNRLYYDLKQTGILAKLDGLWLGINTSRADARLNLVGNSLSLTENGSISFNIAAGWGFNNASWLDTGFNPSTAGGKFAQNSASFGVLVASAVNSGVFMGAYDGSNGLSISRTGNTLNAR
ncbi:TPA: hypothetical protein ACX3LP_005327, partial [Raoultella ornithinolytica]